MENEFTITVEVTFVSTDKPTLAIKQAAMFHVEQNIDNLVAEGALDLQHIKFFDYITDLE